MEEDEEVVEDNDLQTKKVALHFIDCIIQDEQKADANVVLSCLEAAMHAMRRQFPYLTKVIVQSDNAKNLAGKQAKLLLPHVLCCWAEVGGLLPQRGTEWKGCV